MSDYRNTLRRHLLNKIAVETPEAPTQVQQYWQDATAPQTVDPSVVAQLPIKQQYQYSQLEPQDQQEFLKRLGANKMYAGTQTEQGRQLGATGVGAGIGGLVGAMSGNTVAGGFIGMALGWLAQTFFGKDLESAWQWLGSHIIQGTADEAMQEQMNVAKANNRDVPKALDKVMANKTPEYRKAHYQKAVAQSRLKNINAEAAALDQQMKGLDPNSPEYAQLVEQRGELFNEVQGLQDSIKKTQESINKEDEQEAAKLEAEQVKVDEAKKNLAEAEAAAKMYGYEDPDGDGKGKDGETPQEYMSNYRKTAPLDEMGWYDEDKDGLHDDYNATEEEFRKDWSPWGNSTQPISAEGGGSGGGGGGGGSPSFTDQVAAYGPGKEQMNADEAARQEAFQKSVGHNPYMVAAGNMIGPTRSVESEDMRRHQKGILSNLAGIGGDAYDKTRRDAMFGGRIYKNENPGVRNDVQDIIDKFSPSVWAGRGARRLGAEEGGVGDLAAQMAGGSVDIDPGAYYTSRLASKGAKGLGTQLARRGGDLINLIPNQYAQTAGNWVKGLGGKEKTFAQHSKNILDFAKKQMRLRDKSVLRPLLPSGGATLTRSPRGWLQGVRNLGGTGLKGAGYNPLKYMGKATRFADRVAQPLGGALAGFSALRAVNPWGEDGRALRAKTGDRLNDQTVLGGLWDNNAFTNPIQAGETIGTTAHAVGDITGQLLSSDPKRKKAMKDAVYDVGSDFFDARNRQGMLGSIDRVGTGLVDWFQGVDPDNRRGGRRTIHNKHKQPPKDKE